MGTEPLSDSARLPGERTEQMHIEVTKPELELLQDAVSAWIADYIVRVTPKLGSHSLNDARAMERFDAMTAVGRKLGMEL